jgi:hypothetical protein
MATHPIVRNTEEEAVRSPQELEDSAEGADPDLQPRLR